jgi:hypothetical protein
MPRFSENVFIVLKFKYMGLWRGNKTLVCLVCGNIRSLEA